MEKVVKNRQASRKNNKASRMLVIFDSRKAFEQALYDGGYAMIRGDKRGYVAVDSHGEVSRVLAQTRPDSYRIIRVSVSLGLVQFFFIPNQFPTEQGFQISVKLLTEGDLIGLLSLKRA
jgi:hypothetical protein